MTQPSPTLQDDTGNRSIPDLFNRKTFAQRLADTITQRISTESFVIGLYGAWGEGKSTVLDYMDEALTKNTDAVLVRFNPWLFQNDQEMAVGLMAAIGLAIQAQVKDNAEVAKSLSKRILTYGGFVARGVGLALNNDLLQKAGEYAQDAGSDITAEVPTPEEQKQAISSELLAIGKRVVVLLDDIDRLTREEIQQVFRLIKVAVDFPTVTYVLAFDPQMVAAAVGAQYGAGNSTDGERFLEKIVQLPLHLPHADRASMSHYTFELLEQTLQGADINLNAGSERRLAEVLTEHVMPAIETPRQAKRFVNAVAFALPILRGETDPADVVLVEALRVLYPQAFDLVRKEPDLFLDPQGSTDLYSRSAEQIKVRLQEKFEGHSLHAVGIISDLFPDVDGVLHGMPVRWAGDGSRPKSVCWKRYFPRYFQYAIPSDDVPDAEIEAFQGLALSAPPEADAYLRRIAPDPRAFKLMDGLTDTFYHCTPAGQRAILESLARTITDFAQNPAANSLSSPVYPALRMMVNGIQQEESTTASQALGEQLIDLLPARTAISLMGYLTGTGSPRAMSSSYHDQRKQILDGLEEKLVIKLENMGDQLRANLDGDYLKGLVHIANIRGRPVSEARLLATLGESRLHLQEFLVDLTPRMGAAYLPRETSEDTYNYLGGFVDPASLFPLIESNFPGILAQPSEKPMDEFWNAAPQGVITDPAEAAKNTAVRLWQIHERRAAAQSEQRASLDEEELVVNGIDRSQIGEITESQPLED